MPIHFTVVLDACVLYPATLRNILLQLATMRLFRARWTNEIHEEWIRNLNANRPDIGREKLERLREQIDRAVPDSLIFGYEPLVESLELPDVGDRHVLAAAIRGNATGIVTTNLRDFPDSHLAPLGIRAQHPDEFIGDLMDFDTGAVCSAIRQVRTRLKRPRYAQQEMLALLQKCGLPETVSRLRDFVEVI